MLPVGLSESQPGLGGEVKPGIAPQPPWRIKSNDPYGGVLLWTSGPREGRSGGDQVGLDTACEPGTWEAMSKMHPAKLRAEYVGAVI